MRTAAGRALVRRLDATSTRWASWNAGTLLRRRTASRRADRADEEILDLVVAYADGQTHPPGEHGRRDPALHGDLVGVVLAVRCRRRHGMLHRSTGRRTRTACRPLAVPHRRELLGLRAPARDRSGHQLVAGKVSSGDALVAFRPTSCLGAAPNFWPGASGGTARPSPGRRNGRTGRGTTAPGGPSRWAPTGATARTRWDRSWSGSSPTCSSLPSCTATRPPHRSATSTTSSCWSKDTRFMASFAEERDGVFHLRAPACPGAGELRQAHHRGPDLRVGVLVVGPQIASNDGGSAGTGRVTAGGLRSKSTWPGRPRRAKRTPRSPPSPICDARTIRQCWGPWVWFLRPR